MKIIARTAKVRRLALMLGLVAATVGIGLVAAIPANAAVGTELGHVSLSPATGPLSTTPTWSADDNCAAPFNVTAFLAAYDLSGNQVTGLSANITGAPVAPFGGPLQASWQFFIDNSILQANTTYEIDVLCGDVNGTPHAQQYTYVTLGASGGTYTMTNTPPSNGTPTTTSLSVSPSTAAPGDPVNLSATVTPSNAAGNVQFFDGGTMIGSPVPVSGGTAAATVSTLSCGSHQIIAKFVPTDPNAFGASQSGAQPLTISGSACALQGAETINVAFPSTGAFTFTVSGTPVDLGTATANGSNLEATGNLSPATVSDTRNSAPGWSVAGQVGDFSDGTHTIDGNSLGWTPAVTTQDPAGDVVAGPKVNPGSNPGLKQGSGLASAAVNKGAGTTVLGGSLDLVVPSTQNAGSYSATLTLTAIDTAS
jgi:Bacterial Ig-like domain (group 3)